MHYKSIKTQPMKKGSTIFLQVVLIILSVGTLAFMILEPRSEGRNAHAALSQIYFHDPFLVCAYLASIPFFVALCQAFKLLTNIGQNKVFSLNSVKALRNIKYCAIILSAFIIMAAAYIKIFHAKEDDPAGFLALCIVAAFLSIVTATAAAVFERLLQKAVDIKSENDLTV